MSAGALGGFQAIAANQATEQGQGSKANRNAFANLESGEFMNILVKQLTSQNPTNPEDSSQILKQLSSIRTIESQTQLQEKLEGLVSQNQVSKASGMIGKVITGLDPQGNEVEGRVTAVRVTDEGARLELDTGRTLGMDRVTRITAPNTG